MTVIELSVSAKYVPNWGKWEGVRDLAQNIRDAVVMHGAEQDVRYAPKTQTLILASRGASMDCRSLLFGATTKKGVKEAAGEYGEGMKLAFLALVRAGCEVRLRTGDELWTPKLERSEKFAGEMVLTVHTRKIPVRNEVEIEIVGIEPDEWELYKKRLLFIERPKNMISTSHGDMLTDPEYKGKLFVHGIFVQDHPKLTLGYNLNDVKVDRDRGMASDWDVSYHASCVLRDASQQNAEMRAVYLKNLMENAADASGASLDYESETFKDEILKTFDEQYGEGTVSARNEEEARRLRYFGLNVVVLNGEGQSVLRTLLERRRGTCHANIDRMQRTPKHIYQTKDLPEETRDIFQEVERLMAEVEEPVSIDAVDFHEEKIIAKADLETGQILVGLIHATTLADTLAHVVHEKAHLNSEAGDCDPRHTAEIERLWQKLWEKRLPKPVVVMH